MVPESTVLFGKNGPYLYVTDKENKAQLRPVTTGARYHDLIQVADGVAAGETVITTGQLAVIPGAAVRDASAIPASAPQAPVKH